MKLVASTCGKNEQSAASLSSKNQVLGKEIEAQRTKVDALRAALENSAESFGENDSRTKNWQIQLNNVQAVLNGLEGELEANDKALDQMGEQADDLGGELDDTSGKTRIFGDVLKTNLASEAIIAGVKGIRRAIASIG